MTDDETPQQREVTSLPQRQAMRRREQAQRRREALSLILAGLTYDQTAERLGVSSSAVERMVTATLERAENRQADELRTRENARLDRAQQAIWSKVLDGDLKAVDTFLRISARRSKMNGLDAPAKLDLNVSIRQEMEDALNTLEATVLQGEVVPQTEGTRTTLNGADEGGSDRRDFIEGQDDGGTDD